MKRCPKCATYKKLNEFGSNKRRKDGKNVYCLPCAELKQKNFYAKKKNYTRIRNKGLRDAWYDFIDPHVHLQCVKCGYNERREALDFHHTDPTTKDFMISTYFQKMLTDNNKGIMLKELAKCVVFCANCHRVHHADELLAETH